VPKIFDGDDFQYFAWLHAHPSGYVLNTRRSAAPDYLVVHRAACWTIASSRSSAGAYTQRAYIKVCADDLDSLRLWLRENVPDARDFSNACGHCAPS
jgi:hypothetical protein